MDSLSIGKVKKNQLGVPVNPFELHATAELPDTERQSDLFFKFAKTEVDDIEIALPDGFKLGNAHAPRPFGLDGVVEYKTSLGLKPKSNTLMYSRSFALKVVDFPSHHYKIMMQLFQNKAREDGHKVLLERIEEE